MYNIFVTPVNRRWADFKSFKNPLSNNLTDPSLKAHLLLTVVCLLSRGDAV
jgi:hypothetical protein